MCAIPGGFKIPASKLSVFGVPLLADRQHLSPYNISIRGFKSSAKHSGKMAEIWDQV